MSDETSAKKTQWVDGMRKSRLARFLSGATLTVTALWFLFDRVITDPRLALDYTKATLWPVVVVLTLFWLREPLGKKLGALLKVNAFGAEAEFERRTDQLEAELVGPFEALGATATDVDETPVDPGEQPPGDEGALTATDSGDAEASSEPPDSALEVETRQSASAKPDSDAPEAEAPTPDLAARFDDLLSIGRALKLPVILSKGVRRDFEQSPEETYGKVLRHIEAQSRQLRLRSDKASHDRNQTRDGIEAIIRTSADWGYDMARSGAPKTIPDIVWNNDDTWRIKTTIPKQKAAAVGNEARIAAAHNRQIVAAHNKSAFDDARQVRALEEEIKSLEKRKYAPFGKAANLIQDDGWLQELKRRLRDIDPGNPWALP